MRILQLINNLNTGGAEKLILETIPLFNKQNIQTDLAVLNGYDYPFLKILKNLKCCSIFSLGNKSVYNPILIFKIIPLLKKYDLVHVHIFPSLYWVALAKMISFSKVKLVYTEHSTSNKRRKRLVFKLIDKFIYSFYSKIITISPEVDTSIKNHLKYPDDKFILIQNGVNLEAINTEQPISRNKLLSNFENDVFILTQVSSFRYPKDQKTVIKALAELNKDVILLLVGDGPLRHECAALTKELKLKDRVFFLGIRMDVINLLKASDVIILSSHHEGLSLSCVEGMASGKPFIASDAPGLGDIVRHAGLLFPINDYNSLAKQIDKLLTNKTHYTQIVSSCLNRAEDYNIENTISKEIDLYKALLKK